MSDSDDTDVLLLIPPDFFFVHSSDSEDSIGPEVFKEYSESNEFEKLVVNDLISQVNDLQTRISVIENKSSLHLPESVWDTSYLDQVFDCATYQDLNAYQYLRHNDLTLKFQSMLSTQHRFGGSYNNLRVPHAANYCTNSIHSTPVKHRQALSLPSTPSIDFSASHLPSNSTQGRGDSSAEKSAIIIEPMTPSEIISMSHSEVGSVVPSSRATAIGVIASPSNNSKQNQLHQDYALIGEIDQFLGSVKKNSNVPKQIGLSDCNKEENTYKCGENLASIPDQGFGLRDFNNLPVREELIKPKYIAPMEKDKSVDQPVEEAFRDTRSDAKDPKHSTLKPAHDQLYQKRKEYTCGDTVTSVPDLGFGLRSFNSLPVREEEVKRKTILPLGIHQLDTEVGGLKLSDIEKLLKQMEATQHEMEKKLQLGELSVEECRTISEKDSVPPPQNVSFAGDTIGSVPDRGFGVRDVFNSPKPVPSHNTVAPGNGTKVPVQEERFTRRNISLVGTEVTADKSQGPEVHSSIEQEKDGQNSYLSNVETVKKTEGAPQIVSRCLTEQEHMTGKAAARRKLELGRDASTIPDCGAGRKSWYTTENNPDGYYESPLHSSHNIPHYIHNSAIPLHPGSGRITTCSTNKSNHVQGYYLPSIPDLGLRVQKLWTNDELSQGTEKNLTAVGPKHCHSCAEAQIHHNHASDVSAVEHPMLSKPHVDTDETGHQRLQFERGNVIVHGQSERGRGSVVTDATAKKTVDFSVISPEGDVAIVQQKEGLRNKADSRNSFIDSGVNGMTASMSSGTSNLLSLSELWGKGGSSVTSHTGNEHTSIGLRLEEENYRRQLCERMIQQLQARLLEEQQKLAVAVQVDRGKDRAILQLQHAWKLLVHHWTELEEQRHSLASRLQKERETHQSQESEMAQKVKQLESELSKALDFAHSYKEKLDVIETEKLELVQRNNIEMKGMSDRIQDEKQKLDKASQLNCQLIQERDDSLEKVKQTEEKAQEERKLLIDAQREVKDTNKKLYSFEAELSALKEEKETLQLKLKEEKGRINILDQQKKSLQATLDEYKKKEKSLREEMRQLTGQLEKIKVELREYYQEQLEVVVRDKLQEFQKQLDSAETSLHKELEQREHAITEMASKQVKDISEKHQLEMQLIEDKHVEELQLYKLQLAQTAQQASYLEAKLQGYNSRKSEMVEKLHSVMETQWKEALRIVSGNSPLVNCEADYLRLQKKENMSKTGTGTWPFVTHSQSTALDKSGPFSTLKTHSINERHTSGNDIAAGRNDETQSEINKMATDTPHTHRDFMGVLQPHLHQQSTGLSAAGEMPFSQDGLLTYRKAEQPISLQETPLSKQCLKTNQEDELRKYIMMLLDRSPGNPVDEGAVEREVKQDGCGQGDKRHQHVNIPTREESQHPKREKVVHDTHLNLAGGQPQTIPSYDLSKAGQVLVRDGRHLKPPWK